MGLTSSQKSSPSHTEWPLESPRCQHRSNPVRHPARIGAIRLAKLFGTAHTNEGLQKRISIWERSIFHIFPHFNDAVFFLGGTPQNLKVWEKPEASVHQIQYPVCRWDTIRIQLRFYDNNLQTSGRFFITCLFKSIQKKSVLSLTHTFTGLRCLVLCQFFYKFIIRRSECTKFTSVRVSTAWHESS